MDQPSARPGRSFDPQINTRARRVSPSVLLREDPVLASSPGGNYTQVMAIRPELRNELLKLPAEERQELADELYESLSEEPIDPEWENAWSDEITRRAQEIADGRVPLADADEMHDELRAELRSFEK